jgi:hypothetical protein
MYNIINYFLKTSEQKIPDPPKAPACQKIEQQESRLTVKNSKKNKRTNTVYIVLHKNTRDPLGVFDNFELAKVNGEKSTHHNCIIIPFELNDPCKYLFNPVFENK